MMQFSIWTALTDLGLGVNLQHYNPLIDADVKSLVHVPDSWQLIAQMPFGAALQSPDPIQKVPVSERVKVVTK
jgi:predicted oxidoreductase (fatty acid repression mutant protein)